MIQAISLAKLYSEKLGGEGLKIAWDSWTTDSELYTLSSCFCSTAISSAGFQLGWEIIPHVISEKKYTTCTTGPIWSRREDAKWVWSWTWTRAMGLVGSGFVVKAEVGLWDVAALELGKQWDSSAWILTGEVIKKSIEKDKGRLLESSCQTPDVSHQELVVQTGEPQEDWPHFCCKCFLPRSWVRVLLRTVLLCCFALSPPQGVGL
jgi:hypothetical protein